MYDQLTRDLDIPFKRVGAILPAITEEQYEKLPEIKHKAFMNRVYDVQYKTAEELLEMEPNLNPEVKGGLYIPSFPLWRHGHRNVLPQTVSRYGHPASCCPHRAGYGPGS